MFVVLLTSLGTWGLPQMVQKFYAIKNEASIKKGTIISSLFALVVAGGCYFLGGVGRLFTDVLNVGPNGIPEGGFDAIIPTMLSTLSPGLIALVVVLVLSASMSTLSSLVIASSSTLTIDFIASFKKDMKENTKVLMMRFFIVVFIAISAVLALVQYKKGITFIAQLMGVSWGALAGAFLAPFMYSLYWKKTTKISCYASFTFGSVLMILNMFFRQSFPEIMQSPINCGVIAMLSGLIIVPVVSLFTKKPDTKLVEETFACYKKTTRVPQETALGE